MNKSLLLHFSLLVTSVPAFVPPTASQNVRIPIGGDALTFLPNINQQQNNAIQPRKDSMSLSVILESGIDPIVTTLILSAALFGTMALNPDDENETMEAPPVKEEVPVAAETESTVTVNKIEEVVVEPKEEEVKETKEEVTVAAVKEPVTTAVNNDVDNLVKQQSKSVAPKYILPVAVAPPMDVDEPVAIEQKSTPLGVKFAVKFIMPWKKLSSI